MAIVKIVSGGQTGVDRGAIEAARMMEFPYGGYIPKGRIAEDGKVPDIYKTMTEASNSNYRSRTYLNVRESDVTLILSREKELTGGTLQTAEYCEKKKKPYWIENPDQPKMYKGELKFLKWLSSAFGAERQIVLNVAGPRESKDPGIEEATCRFVQSLIGCDGRASRRRTSK